MTDQDAPPAPTDTSAPSAVAPLVTADQPTTPFKAPPATDPVAEPELEPTIRDHAERLQLQRWQIAAVIARLHGEHDDKGQRVFPLGASPTTRMSADDFDAAVKAALHGRL